MVPFLNRFPSSCFPPCFPNVSHFKEEEILGYCMTNDTKFDKGFVLCGVKRSGKSTVMDVLERLIGSKSYICMSFSTLRNENSFQDVIDKKVIAFPDARFRPQRTFYQSRDPGGVDPNVAEFLLNVTDRNTISLRRKYESRWQGRQLQKFESRRTRSQTSMTPRPCCRRGLSNLASTTAFTTVRTCIFGESLRRDCQELRRAAYRRCDD